MQTFQKLSSEITGISYEWKEYFDVSLLISKFAVTMHACACIEEKKKKKKRLLS